jgi:hypothetical protein
LVSSETFWALDCVGLRTPKSKGLGPGRGREAGPASWTWCAASAHGRGDDPPGCGRAEVPAVAVAILRRRLRAGAPGGGDADAGLAERLPTPVLPAEDPVQGAAVGHPEVGLSPGAPIRGVLGQVPLDAGRGWRSRDPQWGAVGVLDGRLEREPQVAGGTMAEPADAPEDLPGLETVGVGAEAPTVRDGQRPLISTAGGQGTVAMGRQGCPQRRHGTHDRGGNRVVAVPQRRLAVDRYVLGMRSAIGRRRGWVGVRVGRAGAAPVDNVAAEVPSEPARLIRLDERLPAWQPARGSDRVHGAVGGVVGPGRSR